MRSLRRPWSSSSTSSRSPNPVATDSCPGHVGPDQHGWQRRGRRAIMTIWPGLCRLPCRRCSPPQAPSPRGTGRPTSSSGTAAGAPTPSGPSSSAPTTPTARCGSSATSAPDSPPKPSATCTPNSHPCPGKRAPSTKKSPANTHGEPTGSNPGSSGRSNTANSPQAAPPATNASDIHRGEDYAPTSHRTR